MKTWLKSLIVILSNKNTSWKTDSINADNTVEDIINDSTITAVSLNIILNKNN